MRRKLDRLGRDLLGEVARRQLTTSEVPKARLLRLAALWVAELLAQPAAGAEAAAGGWCDRAGQIAAEDDPPFAKARVWLGHRREQRHRVGVLGPLVQGVD